MLRKWRPAVNDVGVVVLNYNKYELTISCVKELLKIDAPVQIIIVDNMSQNDSYAKIKEMFSDQKNIDVIQNQKNAGYSAGNNFGIKYMIQNYKEVNYICIMNPDVKITYSELFGNLKNILMNDDKIAAVTGLMITNGKLSLNKCFWGYPKNAEVALGHAINWKRKNDSCICNEKGIAEVEVLPGSFFMIKKCVYEELNGLDEGTFLYNEENILGIRIHGIGMKNALSVKDFYFHNHPPHLKRLTLKQKIKSRKIGNQSRRYLCQKYYNGRYKWLLEIIIIYNYFYIAITHGIGSIIRLFKRA